MPRGDRTGPMGMGPMTGRAAGYCAGYGTPGYLNPAFGRGFGMGFGRGRGSWGRGFGGGGGRGWRYGYYATGAPGWMRFGGYPLPYPKLEPDQEKQALRSEAESLQAELELVKKRLSEIETGDVKTE
ncbi:MAG: DUF5320 domain-containing protein [Vicinamibacteria bacterium]|nr:DUF5320 domain-containing protein [Vicinamibacteria bacterium]